MFSLEEKRENVLNWLYPEDFEVRHNEISNRRLKDTGDWLVKRTEFNDWLMGTPPSPFLWGYGIRMFSHTNELTSGIFRLSHYQKNDTNGICP